MDHELMERLPTPAEVEKAAVAVRELAGGFEEETGLRIAVRENGNHVDVDLPPAVGKLVLQLLGHIANREMVTFVPFGADLTTQQAADILNVSRPFLVKLIETGKLPHYRVGSHRRVRAEDLLAYKATRDRKRADALSRLQALSEEAEPR